MGLQTNTKEHATELFHETLDLNIDGSGIVNVSVDTTRFDFIRRAFLVLRFPSATYISTRFADIATPLPNGIQLFYEDRAKCEVIKDNAHIETLAYDSKINKDDSGTAVRIVDARWSFYKGCPPYGLDVRKNESVYWKISDDITAYVNIIELSCKFEGFKFR